MTIQPYDIAHAEIQHFLGDHIFCHQALKISGTQGCSSRLKPGKHRIDEFLFRYNCQCVLTATHAFTDTTDKFGAGFVVTGLSSSKYDHSLSATYAGLSLPKFVDRGAGTRGQQRERNEQQLAYS